MVYVCMCLGVSSFCRMPEVDISRGRVVSVLYVDLCVFYLVREGVFSWL